MSNPKLIPAADCKAASKLISDTVTLEALLKDFPDGDFITTHVVQGGGTYTIRVDPVAFEDFVRNQVRVNKIRLRTLGVEWNPMVEGPR